MAEKVCDKNCLDCIYFQGQVDFAWCCCYLLITNKRRPCDPGKGCTVKVRGKRKMTDAERHRIAKMKGGQGDG